ncbi:MAG: heme-binding protein [Haloarculaceae archaeon]
MRVSAKAAIIAGGVLLAGWIGWGLYAGRSAKSVPYERVRTVDGVELRHYPATVLVETTAANERTAFRRLFRYISGANRGEESIAMTTPVETQSGESVSTATAGEPENRESGQTDTAGESGSGESIAMTAPVRSRSVESEGNEVRMAFYLPPEYDSERAPDPTESTGTVVTEPSRTVAVDRFSWYAPRWRVSRRTRSLRSTLERNAFEPVGEPYLLRYNDPWTPPFMRRNEVALEVAEAG